MQINIDKGWLPDIVPFDMSEGGLLEAKNLIPADETYLPVKDRLGYSTNAMEGTPLKGIEYKDPDGVSKSFIGTSSKLYRLDSKSLTNISKVGVTDYGTVGNWDFALFGNWVIATNYNYAPQVLKGFTTTNYVDLGGTPPKAKYCLFHKGHLIFAHLNEAGTINPKKLKWSAKEGLGGGIEDYAISKITGADEQVLSDADGAITGMANIGDNFIIVHENSITLGNYIGAPYTFGFSTNRIKNIGAISGTIISIGSIVFFWDKREFYSFDGNSIEAIGFGVKKTVLNSLDYANLHRITSCYDPEKGLIYWLYPTTNSNGTPDRILVYNYRKKVFTHIDITLHSLWSMLTGGITIGELNYPIKDITLTFGSSLWQPNTQVMGCIYTDNKVNTLTGTFLTGTLETGEFKDEDNILLVDRVRPRISKASGDVNVRIGSRFLETEDPVYSSSVVVGSNGYADVRHSGRFLRGEITMGSHQGISGIEVDFKAVGKR